MSTTELTFDQRLRRLARKHRRMQDGVTRKIQPDGLMTFEPRRAMPVFPLRALVMLLLIALVFKAFLLAWHGAAGYDARLAPLWDGSLFEQGVAWIMQPDPMTQTLASGFARIIG